jgi:hypothetical protein
MRTLTQIELWEHQLRIWGAPRSAGYADSYVEMLEEFGPDAEHLAGYDSPEVVEARARRRRRNEHLRVLRLFHRSAYRR